VTLNGRPAGVSGRPALAGAEVVASRSEVGRGQWEEFLGGQFKVVAMGSVAYKRPLPKLTRLIAAPPQLLGEIEQEIAAREARGR
jgi:hypothetical protein